MKVKVINKNTNQQFDCEEIIIDGFKYYLNSSNKDFKTNELSVYKKWKLGIVTNVNEDILEFEGEFIDESNLYKIICCNNPNIDIPQILEEPNETLIHQIATDLGYRMLPDDLEEGIKAGYKESQETHPFSEEDMIEFAEFCSEYDYRLFGSKTYKELFQLWKEQQPKIIYYNE